MAIYHEPPLALSECSLPEIDWMHPVARAIALKRVWLGAFPQHRWDRDQGYPDVIGVPGTSKFRNLLGMQSVALAGGAGDSLGLDVGGVSINREIVGFVGSVAATSAVYLVCGKTVFSSNGTHLEIVSGNIRYSRGSTLSQSKSMTGIGAYMPFHATGIWDKSVNGGRVDVMLNGSAATGGSSNSASTAHQQSLSVGRYGSLYSAIQNVIMAYQCSSFPNYAALEEFHRNPWQVFVLPQRRRFVSLAANGGIGNLSASGGAVAGGTATPSATVALAGVTVAQPGGSAVPAAAVALSETAITVTGGSANPAATVSISASGLAQVAGSLNLSAEVLLAAADGAQAGGNPTLAAMLSAMVSGGAQPGGSATPTGNAAGNLSASGAAQPGGAAVPSADAALGVSGGAQPGGALVMSISVALVATGGAQPGGSASPSAATAGDLSLSGGAQPGGTPALTATVDLTAAGFVHVMTTGVLAIQVALSALDGAAPGGLANPQAAGTLLSASALWTLPDSCRGWSVPDAARRWELPQ